MSTAIQTAAAGGGDDGGFRTGLEPRSIGEAHKLAEAMASTRMCGLNSTAGALLRIMAGRMLGFSAMQSIMEIRDIKGTPVVSAKALVALCLNHPACEYFTLVESTDKVATYKTKRRGSDEVVLSYTIGEAEKAGLANNDNYAKHRPAMLRARASSGLSRAVYPDALMGFYAREEFEGTSPVESSSTEMVGEVVEPTPPAAISSVEVVESAPFGDDHEVLEADSVRAAHSATTVGELKNIYVRAKAKGLAGERLDRVTLACSKRQDAIKGAA